MSLVTASNVSLAFIGKVVFENIGFQIEPKDRIGLVGPNGSGKTTLLKLTMGEILPDSGDVRIASKTRIGYLPQDVQEEGMVGPLRESILNCIPGRVELTKKQHSLEYKLEQTKNGSREQEQVAEKLAEVHQEMNRLNREFPYHEAEKILHGLGFSTRDFDRKISTLSGGWKMRATLAGILYRRPDLLLLDEPTNHLDIPSVHWFEHFLEEFKGAILLISHDRNFLNRQVSRIISLEPEGIRFYSGNYDSYVRAREEERRILEGRARNQEQKVKEARKFIERFRAKASKARQAQSKIKMLKKMEMVETYKHRKTVSFSFPAVTKSGREVLAIRSLSKRFGRDKLYENVNLAVLRGERVAIIGPNGSGKSTLLKIIAGEVKPDKGDIMLGHGVEMGYFAQHHSEVLDPRKTVLEEVYQVVPDESVGFVRGVCGAFLFSGEDVEKPIGVLSGGERSRVSLAKQLVKPGNLMLMDEPTNHLDISSSERLIDALEGFEGTLLFVSHNQSFIDRLATKIWDIADGQILEYPGNLAEYYHHMALKEKTAKADDHRGNTSPGYGIGAHDSVKAPSRAAKRNPKTEKRERAERRRRIREELKPIQEELAYLEERITLLESRQAEFENNLADPEVFKAEDKGVSLMKGYNAVKEELESLLDKWEERQDELETAKKSLGVKD